MVGPAWRWRCTRGGGDFIFVGPEGDGAASTVGNAARLVGSGDGVGLLVKAPPLTGDTLAAAAPGVGDGPASATVGPMAPEGEKAYS